MIDGRTEVQRAVVSAWPRFSALMPRRVAERYGDRMLVALTVVIMFPGMITGSCTASVLGTGAIVAPILVELGLPLIVAAVLVAVALIGVGAWFLTRPAATPPTVDPSTPSASQPLEPRPTPTVAKRDLTFDDLATALDAIVRASATCGG